MDALVRTQGVLLMTKVVDSTTSFPEHSDTNLSEHT